MKYMFKLDIGDWSDDGHGKKETFLVKSSHGIEDVREAYFKASRDLPDCICPENFVSKYEDTSISRKVYDTAKKHGYDLFCHWGDESPSDPTEEDLQYPQITDRGMAEYTLWFISRGNEEIKLEIEKDIETPTFAFYGADSKNRSIGFIGYGLFT